VRSVKVALVRAVAILVLAACSSAATSGPTGITPTAGSGGGSSAAPAATGTQPTAATGGGSVDLCALLSTADLTAAFGTAYGAGVLDATGQCTWRAGGATTNDGKGQVIAAISDSTVDALKTAFPGGVDLTVSGHTAYWNPGQGLQSLWVEVGGGRLLTLSLDPVDSGSQAIAVTLAGIAVAKF
jgi:hypothetical protein